MSSHKEKGTKRNQLRSETVADSKRTRKEKCISGPLPTLLEIFGAWMERQNSFSPPSNLSAYFLPLPPTYKYASAFPSFSRPPLSSALPLELSSEISVEMKLMRLEEREGEGGEEGSSAERGRRREDKLFFFFPTHPF